MHAAHDNLFRTYYHRPLRLSHADDLTAPLDQVSHLIYAGEALGSTTALSQPVENVLLAQGQQLFRAIAAHPAPWADLAARALQDHLPRGRCARRRSVARSIDAGRCAATRSARHRAAAPAASPACPCRAPLCARKAAALAARATAVELRLFGFYPPHIQARSGSNTGPRGTVQRLAGTPTRASACAADILGWMALNLFRSWLGQQVAARVGVGGGDVTVPDRG